MERIPQNFSEEEALFAQEFATKKEGKKFSEQASDDNYEEAKKLLQKLKEKKLNWLEIDWEKIDFNDPNSYQKLEQQLDEAAKNVLSVQKDNPKKIGFFEKYKDK